MSQPFLLLPNGEVVQPSDTNGVSLAESYGATRASQAQIDAKKAKDVETAVSAAREQDLKERYSSWLYAPEAAAIGVTQGAFPGVQSAVLGGLQAIDKLAGTNQEQKTQDFLQGVTDAHPDVSFYASMAGGALSPLNKIKQASLAAKMGVGALSGALISADQLALNHAQTPEGQEKLFATLGAGALVGMVLNPAGQKAAEVVGKGLVSSIGRKLEQMGVDHFMAATLPKGAQEWLQSKGTLSKVQSYLVDNDLVGKGRQEVLSHLSSSEQTTHAVIKEARAATQNLKLSGDEQKALARLLQQDLPDGSAKGQAMRLFNVKTPGNLETLHNLKMEISKSINWKEPDSMYSSKLMAGREAIAGAIDSLFTQARAIPELAEQGERWARASAEFSTIQDLKSAYKSLGKQATETSALGTIRTLLNKAGGAMTTLGALGVPAAGPAGVALKSVTGPTASNLASKLMGPAETASAAWVEGLGQLMQDFDSQVIQTVHKGLSGEYIGADSRAGGQMLVGLASYGNLATMLHLMNSQPVQTVPRLSEELSSKGVNGPVNDLTTGKTAEVAQFLGTQAPSNPFVGRTVAPVHWSATLKEKAVLLDKVNTIMDPLSALRTPTALKLQLIGQVYPQMLSQVQNIVSQEAASRPDISKAGRLWASKITGIAAGPIQAPEIQATLRQLDMQEEAQKQQAQQQAAQSRERRGRPAKPQSETGYQRLLK